MADVKYKIGKQTREQIESYIGWEYERIAPSAVSRSKLALLYSSVADLEKNDDKYSYISLNFENGPLRNTTEVEAGITNEKENSLGYFDVDFEKKLSELNVTQTKKKQYEKTFEKNREDIRTDSNEYSTIKIDRVDADGFYAEIPLINADRYQKLSDPTKWNVLVLYTGSGREEHAVGIIVRKDTEEGTSIVKNNNVGAL